MTTKPTTVALIPAAGIGARLGLGPKALLRLGKLSLLDILLKTIIPLVDQIIIAIPDKYKTDFEAFSANNINLVSGGGTRQQSIALMLNSCKADIVLIQDVARPFASAKLISAVLKAATASPAVGAFLPATVPVGMLENGLVKRYWDSQQAGIFQAPQAFQRTTLSAATDASDGTQFQSTLQMVIAAGYPVTAITGEPENIKITSALDWQIAKDVIAPKLGII